MSDAIQQRMPGHRHDVGGGFSVHRVLPGSPRRAIGPFVFIDYFGPTTLPPEWRISSRMMRLDSRG